MLHFSQIIFHHVQPVNAALEISEGQGEVIPLKALDAIRRLAKQAEQRSCDIAFLDPPYDEAQQYRLILEALAESGLLNSNSIAIAEHSKHFDSPTKVGQLERYRVLKQGDAALSFYRLA